DSDETVPGLRRRIEVMGVDHEDGVVRCIARVREQRGEPERSLPCREQPLAALELTARAGQLDALAKEVDGTEAVASWVVDDVLRILAQRERAGVASAVAIDDEMMAADLPSSAGERAHLVGRHLHPGDVGNPDRLTDLAIALRLDAEGSERHSNDLVLR